MDWGCLVKTYEGSRTMDGIRVLVDKAPLDQRLDLKKFTSTGFEWTYEGAEPSQLALALLADHLGDGAKALALCQPFMRSVVANLENDWVLTSTDIEQAVEAITREERGRERP